MMLLPVPVKAFLAIQSMQWSLPGPTPLQYEPLDRLSQSDVSQGTMFQDILPMLHEWTTWNLESTPRQDHYTILSLALLCLGNNYPSQAHNLVTPLSWAEDTHFGFASPSVYFDKAETDVRAAASYIHALVHRYEGSEYGEYGIMGYSNANFWTKAALQYNQRAGDTTLPLRDIQTRIVDMARGNMEAEQWCQTHARQDWDPRALHQLCAEVTARRTPALTSFAKDAATIELKSLLKHCLNQAGFEYLSIESQIAMTTANKVSTAHVEAFQTNGFVVLRRVMASYPDSSDRLSVAAGIACRLLDSPACFIVHEDDRDKLSDARQHLAIWISSLDYEMNVSDLVPNSSETYYGGGSLAHGDAMVLSEQKLPFDRHASGSHKGWIVFSPCDAQDPKASFVDSLFGKRGSCPTSVVQWSKGTIHTSY